MWRHKVAHLFKPQRSNNHRPRVLHPEAYVVYSAFILITACFVRIQSMVLPQGGVLGYASSISPQMVIEQTNQERERVGLPKLEFDSLLTEAALQKGQDMFSQQYWAHVSPTGKEPWQFMHDAGYVYQAAGENLARDFMDTPSMVEAWMASPTHRANIVNSKYTQIGVAVIDGTLQGYETTLVVQMFGRPRVAESLAVRGEASGVSVEAVEPVKIEQIEPQVAPTPAVLARFLVPGGEVTRAPLFSPLQLSKVFFLAVILCILFTLVYDMAFIGNRQAVRLVGHNFGHILFLITVLFLVILFRGGIVR